MSLRSLFLLLNLNEFMTANIVCNFWGKIIKDVWAFCLIFWYILKPWASMKQISLPWGHHVVRKPTLHKLVMHGCLVGTSGKSSLSVIAFQSSEMYVDKLQLLNLLTTIPIFPTETWDIVEQRLDIPEMPCPNSLFENLWADENSCFTLLILKWVITGRFLDLSFLPYGFSALASLINSVTANQKLYYPINSLFLNDL